MSVDERSQVPLYLVRQSGILKIADKLYDIEKYMYDIEMQWMVV